MITWDEVARLRPTQKVYRAVRGTHASGWITGSYVETWYVVSAGENGMFVHQAGDFRTYFYCRDYETDAQTGRPILDDWYLVEADALEASKQP